MMMKKKSGMKPKSYQRGGMVTKNKEFKTCASCPTPAKCKRAGKCAKRASA
jgi:hypothetical protein